MATPFAGLDRADLDAVHEASMHIVEELGIRLDHERAQAVVAEHGGAVDADGVVTLPRDLLMEAVGRAPSTFTLHARDPRQSVTVGGDGAPVRAPSYGAATVHTYGGRKRERAGERTVTDGDGPDYSPGAVNYERRDATLTDYERLVKLAHAEDAMTCAGFSVCRPTDVSRADRHVEMLARTLTLTDKPVMGPTRDADRAADCMEMVGIATGDPDLSKPRVAGLVNTTPPRSVDEATLGGLLTYADHGQPLVVSSFTPPPRTWQWSRSCNS